jgi:hypothetical protein
MVLAFGVVERASRRIRYPADVARRNGCFSTVEKPLLVDGFPAALRQKQGFFLESQKVNEMLPVTRLISRAG